MNIVAAFYTVANATFGEGERMLKRKSSAQ